MTHSHTNSTPLKIDGVEFEIDFQNDLSISVMGWDDQEIQRWVKPENARRLLALIEQWVRNIPDEKVTGE